MYRLLFVLWLKLQVRGCICVSDNTPQSLSPLGSETAMSFSFYFISSTLPARHNLNQFLRCYMNVLKYLSQRNKSNFFMLKINLIFHGLCTDIEFLDFKNLRQK